MRKTPESFRQACRRFIYTENLVPEVPTASTPKEGAAATPPAQAPDSAVAILNKAIAQMETEGGWVGLRAVGQRLANVVSDFDPRTYGFRNLSDLVRQSGAFEIDETEGRALRIRAKPAPATPAGNRPRRRRRTPSKRHLRIATRQALNLSLHRLRRHFAHCFQTGSRLIATCA